MIYLVTLIICVLIDHTTLTSKTNIFTRNCMILWVFVFLCFGYMTGSDWRNYEMMYSGVKDMSTYLDRGEYGLVMLMRYIKPILKDFWLFEGLMKIIFIWSFMFMARAFTKHVWTAMGISFMFNFLFMTIGCPLRFLISTSLIMIAIPYMVQRKWVKFSLLAILAAVFHTIGILIIIMILVANACRKIVHIKKRYLLLIYLALLGVGISPFIPNLMQSIINQIPILAIYVDSYTEFGSDQIGTIGFWKNIMIGLFVILSRDTVLKHEHGDSTFVFAYTAICFGPVFDNVPIGFRMTILVGFFTAICLTNILESKAYFKGYPCALKYAIYLMFTVVLLKNVSRDYSMTPYSNAIPYILTEHLPYDYRSSYNKLQHRTFYPDVLEWRDAW